MTSLTPIAIGDLHGSLGPAISQGAEDLPVFLRKPRPGAITRVFVPPFVANRLDRVLEHDVSDVLAKPGSFQTGPHRMTSRG